MPASIRSEEGSTISLAWVAAILGSRARALAKCKSVRSRTDEGPTPAAEPLPAEKAEESKPCCLADARQRADQGQQQQPQRDDDTDLPDSTRDLKVHSVYVESNVEKRRDRWTFGTGSL